MLELFSIVIWHGETIEIPIENLNASQAVPVTLPITLFFFLAQYHIVECNAVWLFPSTVLLTE